MRGFQSPIVALELASSPQVFASIVGDTQDPNRTIALKSLRADYLFIAVYWLLFVRMLILFAGCNFTGADWFGIAAGICITTAAVFDVFENSYIAQMLSLVPTDNGHDVINKLRHASNANFCDNVPGIATLFKDERLDCFDWLHFRIGNRSWLVRLALQSGY